LLGIVILLRSRLTRNDGGQNDARTIANGIVIECEEGIGEYKECGAFARLIYFKFESD